MSTFVLNPDFDTTASVPKYKPKYNKPKYHDREYKGSIEERTRKLEASTTLYVGNLSCYTNEYQIYELFSRCGTIKRVIMGLDRLKKTPCGFCFVEYDERESADIAIKYLNRSNLDNRPIQLDIDSGFEEGRQFGRGKAGGQIGDERRKEMDQRIADGDASFTSRNSGNSSFGHRRHFADQSKFMTGSMTCLAFLTALFLICSSVTNTDGTILIKPMPSNSMSYFNPLIRTAQSSSARSEFEREFARLLVTVMKNAKPTMMQAFMRATLEDPKLKEIAIGIFFNSTETTMKRNETPQPPTPLTTTTS